MKGKKFGFLPGLQEDVLALGHDSDLLELLHEDWRLGDDGVIGNLPPDAFSGLLFHSI